MTRDEILAMAREAGFRTGQIDLTAGEPIPFIAPASATTCLSELFNFAALAAAKEREACAVLAEALGVQWWDLRKDAGGENIRRHLHSKVHGAEQVAAAIRARGQKEGA